MSSVTHILVFFCLVFNNQRRLGHPYQNRTPPKRKKPRTSFTRLQILVNTNISSVQYLFYFDSIGIRKTVSSAKVLSVFGTFTTSKRSKNDRCTSESKSYRFVFPQITSFDLDMVPKSAN